jgi:hypothetical protein
MSITDADVMMAVFSEEALAEAREGKERQAKLKALRAADGEAAEDAGEESDDSFM